MFYSLQKYYNTVHYYNTYAIILSLASLKRQLLYQPGPSLIFQTMLYCFKSPPPL